MKPEGVEEDKESLFSSNPPSSPTKSADPPRYICVQHNGRRSMMKVDNKAASVCAPGTDVYELLVAENLLMERAGLIGGPQGGRVFQRLRGIAHCDACNAMQHELEMTHAKYAEAVSLGRLTSWALRHRDLRASAKMHWDGRASSESPMMQYATRN